MQWGVGHVGVGWGGLCRGGVGHAGVGWVMHCGSCRGGVGHADMRWVMHCGSCRGGAGHSGVNGENNRCYSYLSQCRMMPIDVIGVFIKYYLGWGGSCRGGVGHVGVGGVRWVM